ncbi:hypothetical protein N2152v2_009252 [Parachlorella kessleri]
MTKDASAAGQKPATDALPWIACLGQAGDSQVCDDDLTELTMHVYFQSQPGEHLSLVGNHAAFGCWDLSKALVLRWTESHVWQTRAAICVEPGTTLEYKYVLFKDFADEPVWQAGKNQVVHIPEDSEGWRFVVEDSWDASRHEHHVEKHDEHALPQPIPLACFECGECLMPHLHWRGCPKVLGGATQGLAAQGPVAA